MALRYLYLALGCGMIVAALSVGLMRRDLWRPIMMAGAVGVFLETVSEIWYLQDYWNPPTILPVPTPEDALYGFGATALAACAYPFWFRRHYGPVHEPDRHRTILILLGLFVLGMWGLSLTPLLSIWSAALLYLLAGGFAVWNRRDLLGVALAGGLIMAAFMAIVYAVALNMITDGDAFLKAAYLPYGTGWDVRVLGNVPLDEIAWNFARGWCVAAMYPYLSGRYLRARLP